MGSKNKFLKELKKDPVAKAFVWMTDIHVNFLKEDHLVNWAQYVRRQAVGVDAKGVLISGDISEAPELVGHLKTLSKQIGLPIYFVMGNHDYWRASADDVQRVARMMTESHDKITWLGHSGPIALTEKTALVGHDSWYDCMAGDWQNSHVYMRDWDLVHDFIPVKYSRASTISVCRKFAADAIVYVSSRIDEALTAGYETIMVMNHVPPFADAARYGGMPNQPNAAPFYSCPSMGDMILEKAKANPDKKFVCLAGHTHDPYRFEANHNVTCYVGAAQYGAPSFQIIYVGG